MLINILKEMANSENYSYSSLARTMDLDQETIKLMFNDLQRMGYIVAVDQSCDDDKCDKCRVCCTKKKKGDKEDKPNTALTRWQLTEKGKKAVVD